MKFSLPSTKPNGEVSRSEKRGFSLGQTSHSNPPKVGSASGAKMPTASGRGKFAGSPPGMPTKGSFSPPTKADASPAKK